MNFKISKQLFILIPFIPIFTGCDDSQNTNDMDETTQELPNFDTFWNYQDPAATQEKFMEILPQAEQLGNTSYYVELLTQIARSQGLQRKFDEAHKTLDEVEKLLYKAEGSAKVRYLLERGRTVNSSGFPEESRKYFAEAFEVAKKVGEENLAVDAAHMMGVVESTEKSIEWSLKAMETAEQAKDPEANKWLGTLYNNLGWTYHDREEYERALELFEKALVWREENKSNERQIRIAKWCIGRVYRSLGKVDEALELQEKLMQIEGADEDEFGYVYEEMGENFWLLNRKEEAQGYFKKAYGILSKDEWLQAEEPERLERLNRLGEDREE